MGRRGPVPGRDGQVRRRNKRWIDKVNAPAGSRSVRDDEPPRSGKGSSTEVWRAYAEGLGHDVPEDAKRSEIFAMVDEGLSEEEAWHPLARQWYESLAKSGQAVFYEPSDWQTARVLAEILSRALSSRKLNASLIERWQSGATELLTTEGARRRVRVELEREDEEETEADVSELDEYRRRRTL